MLRIIPFPPLFLYRPNYEYIQVDESEAYTKTLEHPHPLDVGPASLKADLLSNGDIFERLGAISGVPPRSVNDSIMTSWMTATLNNNSKQDAGGTVKVQNYFVPLCLNHSVCSKNECEKISETMPHAHSFIDCLYHLALNYDIWYL